MAPCGEQLHLDWKKPAGNKISFLEEHFQLSGSSCCSTFRIHGANTQITESKQNNRLRIGVHVLVWWCSTSVSTLQVIY